MVAMSKNPACEFSPSFGVKSPVEERFIRRTLLRTAGAVDGVSEGCRIIVAPRRGVRSYVEEEGRRRFKEAEEVARWAL